MLLALGAQFGEGHFHAGEHVVSFACGVQRASRKRKVNAEGVAFHARLFFDRGVQFHEVWIVSLEQLVQLCRLAMRFFFDGLAPFFVRVANR